VERKGSRARKTHRTRRDEAGQEASYPETVGFIGNMLTNAGQEASYPEIYPYEVLCLSGGFVSETLPSNACQEA
jgi:hypothetical protein